MMFSNNLIRTFKQAVILFLLALLVKPVFSQPVIDSFSPQSGPVGTLVTIKGSNFKSGNGTIVTFGAVNANVTGGTDTTLFVTVPLGATYAPVTVTSDKLTAYSAHQFIITFDGAKPLFSSSTFAQRLDMPSASTGSSCPLADFDGDGKPDIVTNSGSAYRYISVYKNISKPGKAQFNQPIDIPEYNTTCVIAGDLSGDGKPDLVAGVNGTNKIGVYINTSTNGNISFSEKIQLASLLDPQGIAMGDFDNDGKPDVAVTDYNNWKVWIYRNAGTDENVSFELPKIYDAGTQPTTIVVEDLDMDGKKDIIISYFLGYKISIYRNTSTGKGNISFELYANVATPYSPNGIATGDLDMDGKPDIVTPDSYANLLTVLKNTSTPGVISFAPKIDYPTGVVPRSVSISDMDGDGKPDVIVGNVTSTMISVYKNISTPNNLSLAPAVDFIYGAKPYGLSVGDIDGDGKPDVATINELTSKVCVFRNRQGESVWKNFCPPAANTVFTVSEVAQEYQWQINIGSGFVNIQDNNYYAGSATQSLQLTNVPSSFYGYQYRCLTNGNSSKSEIFELHFTTNWVGSADTKWENPLNWSCGAVPDENTDVIMNNRNKACNINTNITVRSLSLTARQWISVETGAQVTIMQ